MTSSNSAAANKALVSKVMDALFVRLDSSVVEQYFDKGYIQHNPKVPNGRDAIPALISQLPAGFRYEPGMIVAEGDLVMIHGRYTGWGPKPQWRSIYSESSIASSQSIGMSYKKKSRRRVPPMVIRCSLTDRAKHWVSNSGLTTCR
jgi:predicted SnoaL-like aldol condensation-catalyzing enzyme